VKLDAADAARDLIVVDIFDRDAGVRAGPANNDVRAVDSRDGLNIFLINCVEGAGARAVCDSNGRSFDLQRPGIRGRVLCGSVKLSAGSN